MRVYLFPCILNNITYIISAALTIDSISHSPLVWLAVVSVSLPPPHWMWRRNDERVGRRNGLPLNNARLKPGSECTTTVQSPTRAETTVDTGLDSAHVKCQLNQSRSLRNSLAVILLGINKTWQRWLHCPLSTLPSTPPASLPAPSPCFSGVCHHAQACSAPQPLTALWILLKQKEIHVTAIKLNSGIPQRCSVVYLFIYVCVMYLSVTLWLQEGWSGGLPCRGRWSLPVNQASVMQRDRLLLLYVRSERQLTGLRHLTSYMS